MKKVILSVSIAFFFGGLSIAQSNQMNVSTKEAKVLRNLNNGSTQLPTGFMGSRAEGDVFWGDQEGEGDFSNSANWEVVSASSPPHGWEISTNPNDPPNFSQTASLVPVQFSGASNGYALCDSDAAGEGGITNSTIRWNGPAIDCSDREFVSLRFKTATRNFASTYYVVVSNDDGATWIDVPVLQEITTNVNTTNPQIVEINISQHAANQENVRVGFRYEANWGWFWAIDDVELFETWNYDLVMNQNLNSIGPEDTHYTIMPVSQVIDGMKMGFGVEARNIGAMEVDCFLTANQGSNWTGTNDPITMLTSQLESDSLVILTNDGYPVPSALGTYNIDLTLTTEESLQNMATATRVQPFQVSQSVMAGDSYDGTPASISGAFTGWVDPSGDPGIGKDFDVFANGVIGRVAVGISNVNPDFHGDYVNNLLTVLLYKSINGELQIAGVTEPVAIQSSNFGNLVQCYFEDPVQVVAGDYLVAIASFGESATVPIAMSGRQRVLKTYGLDGSQLFAWSSQTEKYRDIPVIRLDFADYTNIKDNTIIAEDVMVFPNPAQDNASIRYTLTEESNVSIVVRDLSGKVVFATESGVVGAGTYNSTIDLNEVARGMYTVTLNANGAQVTQKLMKK